MKITDLLNTNFVAVLLTPVNITKEEVSLIQLTVISASFQCLKYIFLLLCLMRIITTTTSHGIYDSLNQLSKHLLVSNGMFKDDRFPINRIIIYNQIESEKKENW